MATPDCGPPTTPQLHRVCRHVLETPRSDYVQHFTGRGVDFDLFCSACAQGLTEGRGDGAELDLRSVNAEVREQVFRDGGRLRISGHPATLSRPGPLVFGHETVVLAKWNDTEPILDIHPRNLDDQNQWVAVTGTGRLLTMDLDSGEIEILCQLPETAIDLNQPVSLHLSRDGFLAVVVNTRGRTGVVIDLRTGQPTMALERDDYHNEHCTFAVAFFEHGNRNLLVHQTEWNRLDVSDPGTGQRLSERASPAYENGSRPEHYLDYFHCGLSVSPNQEYIAGNGWVWHPCGVVVTWSLKRWLEENVWESEDGPSRRSLCHRDIWDGPLCWVGDHRLAVWGYGEEEAELLPAVLLFDVTTGQQERWFAGPRGNLVFDEHLFSCDPEEGTSVWDVKTGERLLQEKSFCPRRYHHGARCFVTPKANGTFVITRLRGQPVDPSWLSSNGGIVTHIARAVAADRTFEHLPVLADALEEAACQDATILGHCRNPGPHTNRCWVVDRLLDRG